MRHVSILLICVLTLVAAACNTNGMAFRVDERVTITSPKDRAQVTLPVELKWRVEDFEIVEPGTNVRDAAGYFAVFVDRTPIRPGERFVRERGAYATTETKLLIEEVEYESAEGRDRHTATIVLLDGAGRRVGESAFDVVFEVERGGRS